MIAKPQELSRGPKTDFSGCLGIILLLLILVAILSPCCFKRWTHSYHHARLTISLPHQKELEVEELIPRQELRDILSQDFFYLERGAQAFIFASADRNYVLKLFFFDRSKETMYRRFFGTRPSALARKACERAQKTLEGCKMAMVRFPKGTGLLYLHLNLGGEEDLPGLRVHGPAWHAECLNPGNVRFVLQRRCEPLKKALLDCYSYRDISLFRARIKSLFETLHERVQQNICNTDAKLFENFGFIGSQAIEFDVGNYVLWPSGVRQEEERYYMQLVQWIDQVMPEWRCEVEYAKSFF